MILAANLKCNHTRASFRAYARQLNQALAEPQDKVIVLPPSTAFISPEELGEELRFIQGAQNFYPCQNGAFTGEIGKDHLDEFKINCVLIGHSERKVIGDRAFLREKFDFAKKHDFQIIYCIGEDLKTKRAGETMDFLRAELKIIDLHYPRLIIAYEPIYSIGTGLVADAAEIEAVFAELAALSGAPLLYGGSVNEAHLPSLLGIAHCAGFLIGSAAWDAGAFISLISKIHGKN